MELGISLPYWKEPAIGAYPESAEPSPPSIILLVEDPF